MLKWENIVRLAHKKYTFIMIACSRQLLANFVFPFPIRTFSYVQEKAARKESFAVNIRHCVSSDICKLSPSREKIENMPKNNAPRK